MVYTTENTFKLGRPIDKIIDANGFEHKNKLTISVDTVTGEIIQYRLDENDRVIVDDSKGVLLQETVKIAAPVLVTFVGMK